uniref:Probable transport protein n=1 Tax=Pedinomonas minor TaxID=3159 RepID=C7BEQ2_PEDMN|nr:probable transport protein [Pedinomonas minor]ACQ90836.1 probable transport protein [Pedinomonas minor]
MSILIENVSKKFGTTYALKNVNLEIGSGSLTALVGPSGSGKSTLLRIIAGFENSDNGRVWLFGNDATKQTIENREIGFVFQNYALFPNLTVWENIAFGLKIKKVSTKRITERVKELLELIQLESFADAYPHQLSGGQRQRVALARAIAIEPKLLLLDEPFGALDPKVRKDLRNWLKQLHSQVPLTTLLVTHDQQEAMEVADQLVVFSNGKVEQFGTPKEIYDSPATEFIMNFIGQSNKISTQSSKIQEFFKTNSQTFANSVDYAIRPHGYYLTQESGGVQKILSEKQLAVEIQKIVYGESLVKLDLLVLETQQIFKYQTSRKLFEKLIAPNENYREQTNFVLSSEWPSGLGKRFILTKKD